MPFTCTAGVLRIMELPRNLRRQLHNERKLMAAWLEAQTARLGDVGARLPFRTAARKEAEVSGGRGASGGEGLDGGQGGADAVAEGKRVVGGQSAAVVLRARGVSACLFGSLARCFAAALLLLCTGRRRGSRTSPRCPLHGRHTATSSTARSTQPQERRKEAEAAAAAEAAAREAAAKDAAALAASGMPPPPPPPERDHRARDAKRHAALAEFDEKAEAEYLKLEARFKAQLGLLAADANGAGAPAR